MLCVSVAGAKDRDLVQECLKTILSRNCRRIWGVAMDAGVMSRWCITAKRVDKGLGKGNKGKVLTRKGIKGLKGG